IIALIWFVLAVLASPFESKSRLEAENAVLRHQLIVLRSKVRGRRQGPLGRGHRAGFRRYWRWKSNQRGGPPANRDGIARADPADEHGEPALGCATYPRRTAQAWIQRRSINRRQVHGQTTGATQPGMANLSAKTCSRPCRHGPVSGPDHWLQTAVWLGDCTD